MVFGDLIELLDDRKDVTIHIYDNVFQYPRQIKNISMIEPDRILIAVASQEEEEFLHEKTVGEFLADLQFHRNTYNTADDIPVEVFDPETATRYNGLAIDLSISDRVDINCII